MRIFVSYARVDKPVCHQVAQLLNIHEVWFDQRLYAGQNWWREILDRLNWCEVFIYLLSPESVSSTYCRREFQIAVASNKAILPVLIDDKTPLPEELREVQYADLSKGLNDTSAVSSLLNSVYMMEKKLATENGRVETYIDVTQVEKITSPIINNNPDSLVARAVESMEKGKFDEALFLLKQAREKETYRYVPWDDLIAAAEDGLERQMQQKAIAREYNTIAELISRKVTRKIGCQAFQAFRREHPDYDPRNLNRHCMAEQAAQSTLVIPPTEKTVQTSSGNGSSGGQRQLVGALNQSGGVVRDVDVVKPKPKTETQRPRVFIPKIDWKFIPGDGTVQDFEMATYPITNLQFEAFIRDPVGYRSMRWWQWSSHARIWRQSHRPRYPRFKGDNRPRENVTWYEAVAFCYWLGARLGQRIALPTQAQWRRAAMGDDGYIYPWGNTFDREYCNSRESRIHATTDVTRYPNGSSPFGVLDMAGNIWEWCVDPAPNQRDGAHPNEAAQRAVLGGSFFTNHRKCRSTYDFYIIPNYYYGTIGFRVIRLPD